MGGKVRLAYPVSGADFGKAAQWGVMFQKSYAGPLLALGVVGLSVTCIVATSAIESASGSPELASTPHLAVNAVIPTAPRPMAPPLPVAQPVSAPRPAVSSTIANEGRLAACQAEFDRIAAENPIIFPNDRWDLTAPAKASVGKLAIVGKACVGQRIEIQAFTDNQGKRAANTRLSAKRAEAVKEYLVELGLSSGLLTAVGFGSDRPVASNRTASGRARNRRIEFRVTRVESE